MYKCRGLGMYIYIIRTTRIKPDDIETRNTQLIVMQGVLVFTIIVLGNFPSFVLKYVHA